ncbi:phage tail assembly chaperone [Massilia sp. YIM B02443]|uniref:phage tail assembly chaperone n=1 Tax=Massilia sp. YIM B02443 TaxID=3050127 RepID=UPI0025B6369A|nr:phage tail assembly chaperone [Massilia sp. YIM B02443]MDN4040196.1 phage tail assembly chaperone [Massilia sp. YIM B02443]
MAKAKLSLAVVATFAATVAIPVPGGKTADVEFTFKWMNRDDFKEFVENLAGAEDVDALMDILAGWDLDETFNKDQVEKLVQRYMGAARAILDKYIAEITGARAKN